MRVGTYVKIYDENRNYIHGNVESVKLNEIELGDWISIYDGTEYIQGIVKQTNPCSVNLRPEGVILYFPQTIEVQNIDKIKSIMCLKQPQIYK